MRGSTQLRKELDEWFPTLVRYAGIALALYVTVINELERPSLAVLAAGMIGFKTIWGKNAT